MNRIPLVPARFVVSLAIIAVAGLSIIPAAAFGLPFTSLVAVLVPANLALWVWCLRSHVRHARRQNNWVAQSVAAHPMVGYVLGVGHGDQFNVGTEDGVTVEIGLPEFQLARVERDPEFGLRLADAGYSFERGAEPGTAVLTKVGA